MKWKISRDFDENFLNDNKSIWKPFQATTIGYGNNAPETKAGKIFCIFFILIGKNIPTGGGIIIFLGIPYFAYIMSVISDIIYSKMDDWRVKIEKRNSETVPRIVSKSSLKFRLWMKDSQVKTMLVTSGNCYQHCTLVFKSTTSYKWLTYGSSTTAKNYPFKVTYFQ